jgi:hypothetical protein
MPVAHPMARSVTPYLAVSRRPTPSSSIAARSVRRADAPVAPNGRGGTPSWRSAIGGHARRRAPRMDFRSRTRTAGQR